MGWPWWRLPCAVADLPLRVLRFPFPERRWREHVDAQKRIRDQEILITGDDRDALAGQCGRQHDIVVAVATRCGIECVDLTSVSVSAKSWRACDKATTCWWMPCSKRSPEGAAAPRTAAMSTFIPPGELHKIRVKTRSSVWMASRCRLLLRPARYPTRGELPFVRNSCGPRRSKDGGRLSVRHFGSCAAPGHGFPARVVGV
jgi:hypothetical protein